MGYGIQYDEPQSVGSHVNQASRPKVLPPAEKSAYPNQSIAEAMKRLDVAIESMGVSTERLVIRIENVVVPASPQQEGTGNVGNAAQPARGSSLAEKLHAMADAINRTEAYVREIHDRVDL